MSNIQIVIIGQLINIAVALLILLRRYIPYILGLIKRKSSGSKITYTEFKNTEGMGAIRVVIMAACLVLIALPFVFTTVAILSIKPAMDARNDI